MITAMSGKRLTVGVIGNAKKYIFLKGLLFSHLNQKLEGVWFQFGEVMPP